MKKVTFAFLILFTVSAMQSTAQNKLTIDQVYSAYLRNSGTISENNQIRGYFFLYQSDKIDKKTNEYTLQILDQNLNKVREIKFEDSKNVYLLEASYNNNTLAFLFKNSDEKTLNMKIYGLDGKLKFNYSTDYDKKTEKLMAQYGTMHTDEGNNQTVFNVGDNGYVSILPQMDGKQRSYIINYYASDNKKQWSYQPDDGDDKYATAEYMGTADNLIMLSVLKKKNLMSNKFSSHLVGIDLQSKKKVFDLENPDDREYKFVPSSVIDVPEKDEIMVMGSYFNQKDNVVKDFSKGLAIFTINNKGKVLSQSYSSWKEDFSKFIPVNKRGKVEDIGYMFIHKMLRTPDGKTFVVTEGYKRQASAGGIAAKTVLAAAGARTGAVGVTKFVVTDLMIIELNDQLKLSNATVYDKTNNTADASIMSDALSPHQMALVIKMGGGFDYEFTTGDADNSTFTICYSDKVKEKDYKGLTFNSIRYNGSSFSTDRIQLKSKASSTRVFPAKPGFVMILEYFKKEKKLDFRLEKLG